MKKNSLIFETLFLSILVFTGIFYSCEKNDTFNPASNEIVSVEYNGYSLPKDALKNVELKNGLLKFDSQADFDRITKTLENEQLKWESNFSNKWGMLNDEDYEEKVVELNFDSYAPYKAFEKSLGFNSLRAKIEREEEKWLNNEILDVENNPDDHYVIGDELRTLVNENSEIMIGNSIYLVKDNWVVYEITDGNFETLNQLSSSNNLKSSIKSDNIVVHNDVNLKSSSCQANQHRTNYINYRTDRQAKVRVTITNGPFIHFAKAQTTSYKKKKKRWKKYRTNIKARVYGGIRDGECNNLTGFDSGTESKKKKHLKAKVSFGGPTRCKNNEIHSYHYVDGWSTYFDLKW